MYVIAIAVAKSLNFATCLKDLVFSCLLFIYDHSAAGRIENKSNNIEIPTRDLSVCVICLNQVRYRYLVHHIGNR
jgi:hypothetical protein